MQKEHKAGRKIYKIDRYSHFGFREEWANYFFKLRDNWINKMNLGVKQKYAIRSWLKDSDLIRNNKGKFAISEVGDAILRILEIDSAVGWQLVWVNLYYNSELIRWYLDNIKWGQAISKKEVFNLFSKDYGFLAEGTRNNMVLALFDTFNKNSYLGEKLGLGIVKKNKNGRILHKVGTNEVYPLVILYILYRLLNFNGIDRFSVSHFYDDSKLKGNPYYLFGISRDALERKLRWLSYNFRDYIHVDIIADLDNISLIKRDLSYSKLLNDIELWIRG